MGKGNPQTYYASSLRFMSLTTSQMMKLPVTGNT